MSSVGKPPLGVICAISFGGATPAMGVWIAIGVGLGVAMGDIYGNIGLGVAFGAALGTIIASIEQSRASKRDTGSKP